MIIFQCFPFFLQLHLDDSTEPTSEDINETDFFKQLRISDENLDSQRNETVIPTEEKALFISKTVPSNDTEETAAEVISNCLGPSVKLADSTSNMQSERKSTIGRRTAQSKRPGVSLLIYDEIYSQRRLYYDHHYLHVTAREENRRFRCSKS